MTGDELVRFQEALTHVAIADEVTEYAARLVLATHPESPGEHAERISRYVSYGSSPRGLQALVRGARVHAALAGRAAVAAEDIRRLAMVALRHRVILNFEGEAESVSVDDLLQDLLASVPTPARAAA